MELFQLISLVLNLLLGSGLVVTLATLRSVRKEASGKAKKVVAEAQTNEIQNVEAAIKIWREIAQDMANNYERVSREVDTLSKEVVKLRASNNRIAKLLNNITPENLESVVQDIKNKINEIA